MREVVRLLYGILNPLVRKVVKGSSLHQEESYEEFKQASYRVRRNSICSSVNCTEMKLENRI